MKGSTQMTKRFYDRQDNCIRSTIETFRFYKKYWTTEYPTFEEYMKAVFPDFVWIND